MASRTGSGAPLIAAGGNQDVQGGRVMDRKSLATAMKVTAQRRGRPSKSASGVEEKILVASAQFPFPEERRLLAGDWEVNADKIREIVPLAIPGMYRQRGARRERRTLCSARADLHDAELRRPGSTGAGRSSVLPGGPRRSQRPGCHHDR